MLAGQTGEDLVGLLAKGLDEIAGIGDAALVCWAAAESGHSELPHAVTRLGQLDRQSGPVDVVSAAWVVSALVAARPSGRRGAAPGRGAQAAAGRAGRGRLPARHRPGHARGTASHVGSFADQVYPIQALARLHRSAADPEALAAADAAARVICGAQGAGGQWWWHYDARTGGVVEGYPVYSVHQHAMAPDGAARPGRRGRRQRTWTRSAAGCAGWPARPRPRGAGGWSSTSRRSPGARWPGATTARLVRGLRAVTTRVVPGARSRRWTGSTRPSRSRPRVPAVRARLAAVRPGCPEPCGRCLARVE